MYLPKGAMKRLFLFILTVFLPALVQPATFASACDYN